MPASRLTSVQEAIDNAAEKLGSDMMDDTWKSLNCSEVETLAEVFRLTGHDETARMIVGQHAWGDDVDDEHYPFVGSIVKLFSGEPEQGEGIVTGRTTDDRRGARRVTVSWFHTKTSTTEHADELDMLDGKDPRIAWQASTRGHATAEEVLRARGETA